MTDAADLAESVREQVAAVIVGNEDLVDLLTVAVIARGHVVLVGPPGVGKTTIATLFARATGLEYDRIQTTSDLLPADITGTHVYRQSTGEFELHRGPLFSNVVVADELTRAPPKTQSAFLEAMQEGSVTIEGETLSLPKPFMLIATRSPRGAEGTFDLPAVQRDRFLFELDVGGLGRAAERAVLDRFDDEPTLGPDVVEPVAGAEAIRAARDAADGVHVADEVKEYVIDLLDATRDHPDVAQGASTRASVMVLRASKALAAVRGRDYVIPDDVKSLAGPGLGHRLALTPEADLGEIEPDDVVGELVASVPPPGTDVRKAAPGDRDDD